MSESQKPKKSNLRAALVPISLVFVFALGYVAKQVFFGGMR
jgi:hypothetical protein